MFSPKANRNIAIIGFSATGKSIVGKKVADSLGWSFVDTDDEIVELAGKAISEIFKREGENRFRDLERRVLRQACQKERTVISTGGGAVVDPENQQLLLDHCTVISLEARPETIYQRLAHDIAFSSDPVVRPLLAVDDPLERIRQLKAERQRHYAIASWTVHTDNLTIDEVTQEVLRGLQYITGHGQNRNQYAEADLACVVETASASYPVFVGWAVSGKLGERMKQLGLSGTTTIISDETVFSIYGSRIQKILASAGFAVNSCVVPPGEPSKDISQTINIYDFLVEHKVERNDVIVALGGGMIGDLAGFVAATFLRGLAWVQVPTSLIAMTDASIGGKVAVDHSKGKNLIGAFYQPRLVLSDVKVLSTLSRRDLVSGWAEVVKHGMVLDASLLELLEGSISDLLTLKPEITSNVIARSSALKAAVVSEDERDVGKRIVLNYGHTVAHALEAAGKYTVFLHGEAVAMGMMAAAKLSQRLGLLSADIVARQEALLHEFGLPVRYSKITMPDVLSAMELDKKVRNKTIRWVLLEGIGKPVIRSDVPDKEVMSVLQEMSKR